MTLFVNWVVKPFSMALLGWLFIRHLFAPLLPAEQLDSYVAGLILLAAAPCTAMVFVWSRLTGGDPLFTLSQVALNDTIMVFAFAPIVGLLLGISSISVPWATLLTSVVLYIVIPVLIAQVFRRALIARGQPAFERAMASIGPWSITALLATLVLLFAFQGQAILRQPLVIALLAVPILIQVLFNASACLLAQPQARRAARHRLPVGADRRQQFLRTRRRRGDQPVRLRIGRGARDRGRRADRGAGDAAGGARSSTGRAAGTKQAAARLRGRPHDRKGPPTLAQVPPTPTAGPFACAANAWREHQSELKGYLIHRLADPAVAEDLLQEVFVKAMRQGERFCGLDNPRAWLFQVARNALVDHLRLAKASVPLPEDLAGRRAGDRPGRRAGRVPGAGAVRVARRRPRPPPALRPRGHEAAGVRRCPRSRPARRQVPHPAGTDRGCATP